MVVGRLAAPLTKIGFRRDVRLFLSILVGFLALLIVVLVFLLQSFAYSIEAATLQRWNAIADYCAADLTAAARGGDIDTRAGILASRYELVRIEINDGRSTRQFPGGAPSTIVNPVRRITTAGTMTFVFDGSRLRSFENSFKYTAAICIAAAGCGMIVLFFYLPRITRPIELLLDQAREISDRAATVEEDKYLIETFRMTIDTLKAQERELQRLHDVQKSRADDLERVTATLTRSLTSGFIACNATGRIVDINSAAREMLHLDMTADFAGASLGEVVHHEEFAAVLENAMSSRTAVSRKEVTLGGPESMMVGLTTVPLFSHEHAYIGLLALFTDLTPIRRLENRVREMEKLADIGEMSAGIAHEFRNSLSTILGYVRLSRREELAATTGERLRKIEDEAAQLREAVERFLNFARPMSIERRPLDLLALVRATADRIDLETVPVNISGNAVTFSGDAPLLGRAIENVLRNAVESIRQKGEPGGQIDVAVSDGPPAVTVADNGVGIDWRNTARLFLPFQSDKPGGFGIGLALTRKIVVMHGGEIQISGEPGVGATVTMRFPPADEV